MDPFMIATKRCVAEITYLLKEMLIFVLMLTIGIPIATVIFIVYLGIAAYLLRALGI